MNHPFPRKCKFLLKYVCQPKLIRIQFTLSRCWDDWNALLMLDFLFLFWLRCVAYGTSPNLRPLQWKHGVITAGWPGKSHDRISSTESSSPQFWDPQLTQLGGFFHRRNHEEKSVLLRYLIMMCPTWSPGFCPGSVLKGCVASATFCYVCSEAYG